MKVPAFGVLNRAVKTSPGRTGGLSSCEPIKESKQGRYATLTLLRHIKSRKINIIDSESVNFFHCHTTFGTTKPLTPARA